MLCDRCHKETNIFTTSMFNTETIYEACKKKEMQHPMYQEAAERERQAVLAGDYNFPGIGKPADL